MGIKAQDSDTVEPVVSTTRRHRVFYVFDILLLVVAGAALYYGVFWKSLDMRSEATQLSDVARYQCYTVAFWNGISGLEALPDRQCTFITQPTSNTPTVSNDTVVEQLLEMGSPQWLIQAVRAQSHSMPLHALPSEYPLIVMIPFSLASIAPLPFYQVGFALLMVLIMSGIYFALKHFACQRTAYAFIFFMVAGCWGTALGRFDLVPAALTFGALLCAECRHWKWAFALLALATLTKFYALILLPPLFIAQQMQYEGKWSAWQRFIPTGIFVGLCIAVTALSLLLSVAGTISPLRYFTNRPVQVESFAASVLWFTHSLSGNPISYEFSFGSRNVISPFTGAISLGGTLLLIAGFLYTCWLQLHGKISLAMAALLVLLILILTGKVFSAQYLVWVAPLLTYVSRGRKMWVLGWGCISLSTTLIYPFLYERSDFPFGTFLPEFHTTVFVRNVLFLVFICSLLFYTAYKGKYRVAQLSKQYLR